MDVINIILSSYPHIVFRSSPTLSAKGELHTKMTDITEQELSREEVAMELVDGAQESTSYRTQITESERGWMEDMGNVDDGEVYQTYEEREWMKDMRNVYEVYETITPRFTVPNPEFRSPRLPLEICMLLMGHIDTESDYFFRRMNDGLKTLCSCCLLCHALLDESHRFLYQDVNLYSHSEVESFLGTIGGNADLQRLSTRLFLFTSDVEAYHQLLLRGQALLPKLDSLELSEMPVLNPRLLSQPRPFPSVTVLHLSDCRFASVLDIRRLIDNFFPNLSQLYVEDLELTSSYVTLPKKWPRKVVSLSSLDLYTTAISCTTPLGRWLSSTPTKTSIRSLWIRTSDMRMLLSCGQNIEDLALYDGGSYDKNEAVSLGSHLLPNLKSLEVSFRDDDGILDFCALFARCHPSPTLRHIRLRFPLALVSSSDAFSQLDDTFSVLPHTQVSIGNDRYAHQFPKLREKRMLLY
ncbi:hypothetical protein C8Q75DRAFT_166315 [Abortiporus biennis]|nr:hypothetical protein C8Q75DRAFT_166315 [Abortiporus biennis]